MRGRYRAAMRLKQFIVDAFVIGPFSGNPAAVCPLDDWIDDASMQSIALQNNLSETAFFVARDCSNREIRWFTPTTEVDLCGHATLASAHVLADELHALSAGAEVEFASRGGTLSVARRTEDYEMRLPAAPPAPADATDGLIEALAQGMGEVYRTGDDLMVVFDEARDVRECRPDFVDLAKIDARCIYVTAPADDAEHDFVTRVFGPAVGINEDPATGSAQCGLAPYWITRFARSPLKCHQASARSAELTVDWSKGEPHVAIGGRCRTFSRGEIDIPD